MHSGLNSTSSPADAVLAVSAAAVEALRAGLADNATIDCGASLISAELYLGIYAGSGLTATITGSAIGSLEPTAAQLRAFGAQIETTDGGLPAHVRGTLKPQTRAFLLVSPSHATHAALVLAARSADISIVVRGDKSYDDTVERYLAYLDVHPDASLDLPNDFGSAAAQIVDAVLAPGGSVRVDGVSFNHLRTGLLDVLEAMGAPVTVENERELCGQPIADLIAHAAPLRGLTIAGDLLERSRAELPLIARLARAATGETRILGRRLPEPDTPHERLPNGIAFPGRDADTPNVSEERA